MIDSLSVIGLGKLGTPLAAVLADAGFDVIGVDSDPAKVDAIRRGISPVVEPGIQDILDRVEDTLSAESDVDIAVLLTDATFVIVPTPSDDDGTYSLTAVRHACVKIGTALRQKNAYHLVVITSTVMPGDVRGKIIPTLETASGKRVGVDFGVCYSPEFIALGDVVRGLRQPDFVLIGEHDQRAGDMLESIYRRVVTPNTPIQRMSIEEAELTKIAVNTFIVTKITFANMLAQFCEHLPGANVDTVTRAMGLDSRIGGKYLRGGTAAGGPCLPRDGRAMARAAELLGVETCIPSTIQRLNDAENRRLLALVRRHITPASKVWVSSLSYKPGTNWDEESTGLYLCMALSGECVLVDEPDAADVLVITLPEPLAYQPRPGQVVIDCWRTLNVPEGVELVQIGVGR